MLDAENQEEEEETKQHQLEPLAFIGSGNNSKLAKESLIE
jgi:hypothetical protein